MRGDGAGARVRRIYLEGGPAHGEVRAVPDSAGPVYYVPLLPPLRFSELPTDPSDGPMARKLEYRATGTWVVNEPTDGEDAEVYALDMETRLDLLPSALSGLASFLDGMSPADLATLDRIAWSARREKKRVAL